MIGTRAGILCLVFLLVGFTSARSAPQFDPLGDAHTARRIAARMATQPTRAVARPVLGKEPLPAGAIECLRSAHLRHSGRVLCLAFSPDGRLLAAGRQDGHIDLVDFPAHRLLRRLAGHPEPVARLTFSPDGRTLASRSRNGHIRLWDTDSGRQRREIQSSPPSDFFAHCLAYSPNGKMLAADHCDPNGEKSVIRLWDPASGREIQNLQKKLLDVGQIIAVAFSVDGDHLRAATRSGWSCSWRLDGGRLVAEHAAPLFSKHPSKVVISPDGDLAAIESTGPGANHIRVAKATGRPCILPGRVGWVKRLALSPDGRYLLGETLGDVFHMYEMASGQEVLLRKLPAQNWADAFTFTADGRYFVYSTADATLLVWDVFAPAGIRGGRPARLWADLKDDFAAWAHQAVSGMIAAGDEAVVFLERNLPIVEGPNAEQVARWIVELDSDEFRVRERATKQLAKAGETARSALERALLDKPSLEARRRIDLLLADLPNGFVTDGETLRHLRAVTALEHIGTPAARRWLRRLSEGADAPLTREAKAALARLAR